MGARQLSKLFGTINSRFTINRLYLNKFASVYNAININLIIKLIIVCLRFMYYGANKTNWDGLADDISNMKVNDVGGQFVL